MIKRLWGDIMFWHNALINEYSEVRKFHLNEFSDVGTEKSFPKKTLIKFEKDKCVLLITSGRVKVSTTNANGSEKILYILSTGDLIGEIDLFISENHPYDVCTIENTVIKDISKDTMDRMLAENAEIYPNIIKSIIRKYQITSSQLTDNVFKDSDGKIASIILRMAEQEGQIKNGHVEYFYLKQQDIADLIGSSRVTVSRGLNKFKKEGSIDIKGSKIIILDKEKLEEYIQR